MADGAQRRLFVAATCRNDGKTTCALGLLDAYRRMGRSVGFIKPVGQRYVQVEGESVDEDSVLVRNACGLPGALKDMSPIAIDRTFTRRFLDDADNMRLHLEEAISRSFASTAAGKQMVVIEGTGHAGVGSVFDLNNARVARMLRAKVVIVTLGGIGRPVDEVEVNRTLFEREDVEVIGVIVNKIRPELLDQTRDYLARAFGRRGLVLRGSIPFVPQLTWPTVGQVAEAIGATVLNGRENLARKVAYIVVGAMTAHNAVKHIKDGTLLVVPGDRDDVVLAAVSSDLLRKDIDLSGIVLTGGLQLAVQTRELIMRTPIPVLAVRAPTYETTSMLHDATVKIHATDTEKIELANRFVSEHADLDGIWNALG